MVTSGFMLDEGYHRENTGQKAVEGGPEQEGNKVFNITSADAGANPWAVVVVHFNTYPACSAVESSRRPDYMTGSTETEDFIIFICLLYTLRVFIQIQFKLLQRVEVGCFRLARIISNLMLIPIRDIVGLTVVYALTFQFGNNSRISRSYIDNESERIKPGDEVRNSDQNQAYIVCYVNAYNNQEERCRERDHDD